MSELLTDLFSLFCHQQPDRSPQFAGTVFPACYRCAGLYAGVAASYIYVAASGGWRRSLPDLAIAIPVSLAVLPWLVDGWGNTLQLWSSPGGVRSLTGLGAGLALPLLLVPLCRLATAGGGRRATLRRRRALVWPLALGAMLLWPVVAPISRAAFAAATLAIGAGLLALLLNLGLAVRGAVREAADVGSGTVVEGRVGQEQSR